MTDRETALAREVRDLLKAISPTLTDTIETMGLQERVWEVVDSLSLLDLVASLEEKFKLVIEPVDVIPDHFRSIEKIALFIAARTPPAG